MRVPEQTNHYYYYKYIIYNKKNNKQNDRLPPLLCYSMRVVLRYCHRYRVPEHARTRRNTGTRMVLFLSLFAALVVLLLRDSSCPISDFKTALKPAWILAVGLRAHCYMRVFSHNENGSHRLGAAASLG